MLRIALSSEETVKFLASGSRLAFRYRFRVV
jgi:hypothetical protein